MTQIFNKKSFKKLRQKLRNESPPAETILWQRLRRKQIRDLKFHRQYGIGNSVVDFYCPEIKLVIEVDGDTHYQPGALPKDLLRSNKLQELGLVVLRFDNNDVYDNLSGVMDKIYEVANNFLTPSNLPAGRQAPPFKKGEQR